MKIILVVLCCSIFTLKGISQSNRDTNQVQLNSNKSLEEINKELEAINIKIQYVKSHPEELEIAVKESWFKQMEEYKITLEKEKAILQK